MKNFIVAIVLLLHFFHSYSQDKVYTYFMDEDFRSTEKAKAKLTAKGFWKNGLFKLNCFVVATGERFITANFTDSSLKLLNGPFESYHPGEIMASKGEYKNGEKNAAWREWDEDGAIIDSAIYSNGKKIFYISYVYLGRDDLWNNKKFLHFETECDSLKNTLRSKTFTKTGELESEVYFTGDRGVLKKYLNDSVQIDSVFTRVTEEAQFEGGNLVWARFLEKTLGGFNPADNKAPPGKYMVIVRFIVDVDGTISNVFPETNFGFGMEAKIVDVIGKGPAWLPAMRYGKAVKAYRRQPVTFVVEEQ